MQNFFPELIQLNIPFIFLLLIAIAGFFAAYFMYKKTVPQISGFNRYVLIVIRASVFSLIILLFFAPSFFITYKENIKPRFAVFIDNSKSMGYEQNDQDRWAETLKAAENLLERLPSDIHLDQYAFNNSIDSISADNLQISEASTNFGPVINLLKNEEYDKAVIISDGNHTESNYPVEDDWPYDTEIYTIGIGSVSSGADIAITNVIYQPVSYLEEENQIEAQVRIKNLEKSSTTEIKLFHNGQLIRQKMLDLPLGSFDRNINFSVKSSDIGLNNFRLDIKPVSNEVNKMNNTYTFVQNILNNKIQIGLFSGAPSYDSKFTAFLIKQVEDFELYEFVERNDGRFFGSTNTNMLENLDILIFCGFPGKYTTQSTLDRVLNLMRSKQPSLLFYLNTNTDVRKLQQFRSWLPYESLPNKMGSREIAVSDPMGSSIHPLIFIFDQKEVNQIYWSKAPPVQLNFSGGELKNGASTLVYGSVAQNRMPLVILNEQRKFRSVLFNGEGYWKWHFLFHQNQQIAPGYQKLLVNMVRWANDRAKLKPVMLKTESNVAHLGELVKIKGYLYDAAFQPLKNGELVVKAEWNNQEFNLETVNDSAGTFLTEFIPPGEGKYKITGRGFKEGIELGNDQLELEIVPVDKEFINVDQNVNFLEKIAAMGNGFYIKSSQMDTLASALKAEGKTILKDRVIDIWYHPVLLTIIILLISLEWIIRKRFGLI